MIFEQASRAAGSCDAMTEPTIGVETAIELVMRSLGCSRRNAVRYLAKGVKSGKFPAEVAGQLATTDEQIDAVATAVAGAATKEPGD
jgi:hypothetical protein